MPHGGYGPGCKGHWEILLSDIHDQEHAISGASSVLQSIRSTGTDMGNKRL
jgi:hypothetical protein